MSTIPPLNTIANATPLDATPVHQNFQSIAAYIDAEVIVKDGTKAMTGALTLPGPPTAPLHAATKGYVDAGFPTGSIIDFAGAAAPTGWALCDGQEVSSTDPIYVPLFAVIGTKFGAGAGANFKLPNFQGKMSIGVQDGHLGAANPLFNVVGEVGGVADAVNVAHAHTSPAHAHTVDSHAHTVPAHAHSNDHDHPNVVTDSQGAHAHTVNGSNLVWALFGSGTLGMDTSGTGHSGTPSNLGAVDASGAHQHNVDVPNHVGVTGTQVATATDTQAPSTNSIAATVDSAGVSGVNQNYPPFLAVNKIIKL
jgi:microcystin-dependent protein